VHGITDREIRFGMVMPFSGSIKETARLYKLGIDAAFNVANDAGGTNGRMGGFTNEVQHLEFLSLAVARLVSPVVHCFMIGAAVKGDPQARGARAHP
jgi:hypothetical protein